MLCVLTQQPETRALIGGGSRGGVARHGDRLFGRADLVWGAASPECVHPAVCSDRASFAACSGLVLDAVYGHSFSYLSVIFIIAAAAAALTAERGHRQLPGLFAAGAVAGSITAIGVMIAVKITSGQLPAPDRFSYLLFSAGGGGIYLVLGAMLFDFFAERANLPRCIRNTFTGSSHRQRRPVSRTAANTRSRRKRS